MFVDLQVLKEKSKKHCRRSLAFLPHGLTYCNAACGFLAITQALVARYDLAALCILLGILWDGLDGRAARKFGFSSYFGMELDSLADAITFCLAPVVLVYSWQDEYRSIVSICSLLLYLCAGMARLAKFNTRACQSHFVGLPTPCAAFLLTIPILLISLYPTVFWYRVSLVLPVFLGILMVIPVRIPSGKRHIQ